MVKKISTIICQVADMDTAIGFYRDVLGLAPGMVSPWWSTIVVGDVQIGLHPPFAGGNREIGRGWILGIQVDDLRSLRAKLEGSGTDCAEYHDIPGGCVMDFADPDGNPIQAMQHGVSAAQLGATP
jgi:catechol 2,3-dioxygenase-like lactoylglutathione lyase family enzyme